MSELRLITGKKGSGKTLWTVDQLFKEFEKGFYEAYYSDITGLKHTGVKEAPEDWRDIPNNSLIVFDEVQFKILFSRHNSKRDTQILDLTTMRKRGIAIWIITQKARFLNADVLGLVDKHFQIERNGKKTAKVWEFNDAEINITKTKKLFAFDGYVFAYPEELYQYYKSVETDAKHAEKSYLNKGVVSTGITLAIVAMLGGYFIYQGSSDGMAINATNGTEQKSEKKNQTTNPFTQPTPVQQDESITAELQNKINQCVSQFKWTPEQCREGLDPEYLKRNNDAMLARNNNTMDEIVIQYNASRPYDVQYKGNYQVTAQPVFSGCIKSGNKYVAYSQQGTRLDVSTDDCKRLIDDGDRPFNYFSNTSANAVSANNINNVQNVSNDQAVYSQHRMTPEQYYKYLQYLEQTQQANNVVVESNNLTSRQI
ncbi:zonular occludens toxin domain-containing protein [Acinetobacter sp. 272263]|uniref:zonular occludens toxin domain-containing protein n=1 Tax=Acinetobacter sp. 272263 TaxID=1310639 RepID=UPI00045022D5|nr:zonular occludens toxin domain-containing protein [Acinetobacter sp. 272263]EXB78560.1 zonular occludens toxin family protein [Acinetobacter sp. 272263]